MNIEQERELFEENWAKYNGFNLMLDWDDSKKQYKHDATHFAFSCWLASVSREVYDIRLSQYNPPKTPIHPF